MTGTTQQQMTSRRQFFRTTASGLASVALAGMAEPATADHRRHPLALQSPHFTPRAKRVIFIFLDGGPSQMDLTDYKPELTARDGEKGRKGGRLLGPPWKFSRRGESGLWMSELIPHLGQVADDICILQGMQTNSSAHPLATPLLHTGSFQFSRPSVGSWVLYGLGTESNELPGFIVFDPSSSFGGPSNYGSAFLPSVYQGTPLFDKDNKYSAESFGNLSNDTLPPGIAEEQFALLRAMNQHVVRPEIVDPAMAGVLDATELSRRMEATVPTVMDLSGESQSTLDMYGLDGDGDDFAYQCLFARRFAEAGVRYIELTSNGWDHHDLITEKLTKRCRRIDQPITALITDLKQRGMLDDTLVIWGGEFGRTPEAQVLEGTIRDGRDHNAAGYSMWLAGGGVRGGLVYGQTDELGYKTVRDAVHLHDLHATMLYLLGIDHEKLTYRYAGRDFRLTDVHGTVVKDILS